MDKIWKWFCKFDDDNDNDKWYTASFVIIIILLLLAMFFPRDCQAATKTKVPCDTIPIKWEQVEVIFQKASPSGKSVKWYVVFTHNGEKQITTTTKTAVEYIAVCDEYGVKPKIAIVRDKRNGEIRSLIVTKKIKL